MATLRLIFSVMILIAFAITGALFAVQNTVPVPLDLIFVQFAPRTMSLWILLALSTGCLLGLFAASFLMLGLRTKLSILGREKSRLATEVDRLRTQGAAERE
tara:strand:+ start:714 stop:1019 length:306 start_codon:yes stop_codon:yes gene_type:complete